MKCDQDLCLNFWYDFKKLLWQDEVNPRVRCAFGNDSKLFCVKTSDPGAGLGTSELWHFVYKRSSAQRRSKFEFSTLDGSAQLSIFPSYVD